jgi:Ser/Thr protein kinase RdoA (MazF antagonist)
MPPAALPDLRLVLDRYPRLSPWTLQIDAPAQPGFSGAGVCRIETSLGPIAVRRWPAGWRTERLRGLHRLLAHLRDSGVEFVAVPHRADNGDTLVEVAGSVWQVEPWRRGVADYHRQPSRARLTAAMHALADWHRAAATFVPRLNESPWFAPPSTGPCPAVVERLDTLSRLIPAMLLEWTDQARRQTPSTIAPLIDQLHQSVVALRSTIAAELQSAVAWDVSRQVCLRDVWHDHILFTGSIVTGLIDPSAARTDGVAGDLARLLGSLAEDRTDDWRWSIEAYRHRRPLTIAEERLIPILDRSGVVLSAVTWLRWLGPEARRWPDFDAVAVRLQRLASRCERLRSETASMSLILPER